jgi:hypothetical protein
MKQTCKAIIEIKRLQNEIGGFRCTEYSLSTKSCGNFSFDKSVMGLTSTTVATLLGFSESGSDDVLNPVTPGVVLNNV